MTFQYAHDPTPFSFQDALQREANGEWLVVHFDCPTGHGMLTARFGSRICDIHDFAVKGEKRKGDGRRTMLALREHFDILDVPNPVAWRFWQTMEHEGLVRDLFGMDESYQEREETAHLPEPVYSAEDDLCPF